MLKFLLIEGAFSQEKKAFGEQDKGGGIAADEQKSKEREKMDLILENLGRNKSLYLYTKSFCVTGCSG